MSFRPRNYQQALDYLNARRPKERDYRVISREQHSKGAPSEVRDQLVAHTNDPLSTYGPTPPAISFRQWSTNIATFYPDGSVAITPWDSNSTRERMDGMGLPCVRSPAAMGMTKNQQARLVNGFGRLEMKGFRYGVAADRTYSLAPDKTLHPNEGEPTEDIYVEAEPGVHKRYQLGRKRLLKVLKQYADMVEATTGYGSNVGSADSYVRGVFVDTALACPSLGHLRERWMYDLMHKHTQGTAEMVVDLYYTAKEELGLYDLTHRRELWVPKTVKSRELDQWL